MHVITLDDRLPQTILIHWKIGDRDKGQRPNQRSDDVPVGDVDLSSLAPTDRLEKVVENQGQAASEEPHDRPNVLPVLLCPVGNPEEQKTIAQRDRKSVA